MTVINYTHVAATTGTVTVVTSSPGNLYGIVLGSNIANNSLSIYDSTSQVAASKIATIIESSLATAVPKSIDFFGMRFKTRLTIESSGACDYTVIWS